MNFYSSPTDRINTVNAFGLEHPAGVAKLLAVAEALEESVQKSPGWEGVLDPKKVARVVRTQAEHLATTGEPLVRAANQARAMIADALRTSVADNLEAYLEQIEPGFTEAARRYAEAAPLLPSEFTAEDVTSWGPETFTAYTEAKAANAVIEQARQWLLDLGRVVPAEEYRVNKLSTQLLVLQPATLEQYAAIQTAGSGAVDAALKAVDPVRLHAVQDGVALSLSLPSEAAETAGVFEQRYQALGEDAQRELRRCAGAY